MNGYKFTFTPKEGYLTKKSMVIGERLKEQKVRSVAFSIANWYPIFY